MLPKQVLLGCPSLRTPSPLFSLIQELLQALRVEVRLCKGNIYIDLYIYSFVLRAILIPQVCPTSGRQLADMFLTLPDPAEFADYYEAIARPVSLALLSERLYAYAYTRLDAFHRDVLCMFQNARQYNEPSSQVFFEPLCLHLIVFLIPTIIFVYIRLNRKFSCK